MWWENKNVSCQSTFNNLHLNISADEIKCLNSLEVCLISKMLLFKKNTFVDLNETFSKLPGCETIFSKAEKNYYTKAMVFEPVNPEKVK